MIKNSMDRDISKLYPHPYCLQNNCLYVGNNKDGDDSNRKLCNFAPYIVKEITIDDGREIMKHFSVSGVHESGEVLPEVLIEASDLTSGTFNWVITNWGARCNIEAGRTNKDIIRHALQSTAVEMICETIYKQLGWKKINGEWEFLITGGSHDVRLEGKVKKYCFKTKDKKKSAMALKYLIDSDFVPKEIVYPLIAFTFLSPLNSFLKKADCEPKTVMCLIGKTGTKKSTLAALFLSCFGSFTNTDLPLSFRDTGNSIISASYALKDVLTVIDDFHPSTRNDESKMTNIAQAIMRAFGDRAGRSKLKSDSSMMPGKAPTGNAIITGEQAPDITESGLARTIILELKHGDIDLDKLTVAQEYAREGLLSSSMKRFTGWLKVNFLSSDDSYKEFIESLNTKFCDYRKLSAEKLSSKQIQYHDRLPETEAWLNIGMEFFLKFLYDCGVIDDEEYDAHIHRSQSVHFDIITSQAKAIKGDAPSVKFITKLQALIASDSVTICKTDDENHFKGNNFIGYYDKNYYYLITDIVHSAVKKLCFEQDESFSLSKNALLKHLLDDGYIQGTVKEKTKVMNFFDRRQRYMVLDRTKADCSSK